MDLGSQRSLPLEVVAVLGSNFGRHAQCAKCVALSPDERLVASGSRDEAVRIWDAETMALVRAYPHPDDVDDVWFSEDGRFIHSACWDGMIRTFDLHSDSQKPFAILQADSGEFSSVTYRKGNGLLASNAYDRAERGMTPAIVDYEWTGDQWTPTGREFDGYSDRTEKTGVIACSEDGLWVATQSQKRSPVQSRPAVVLWNASINDSHRKKIRFSGDYIERMSFDPETKYLILTQRDGSVQSISIQDGSQATIATNAHGKARCFTFSHDATQLFIGSYEGRITVWDWNEGHPTLNNSLPAHGSWVSEIVFSKDGRLMYSSGWDHIVHRWTREDGRWAKNELIGHDHPVSAIAYSKDCRWIATGAEAENLMDDPPNDVLVWELGGDQPILKHRLSGCMGSISSLAFSDDSKVLAAGHEQGIIAWDVDTFATSNSFVRSYTEGERTRTLSAESLLFLGDTHRIVSGWNEGMVLLVDLGTHPPTELDAWKAPFHYVESIDVTSDGRIGFVSSIPINISDDRFMVQRNEELDKSEAKAANPRPERVGAFKVYRPIEALYSRIATNSDATVFVGASRKGSIAMYENYLTNTDPPITVDAHPTVIEAIDVRDDGLVASGDWGGNIRLWDLKKSKSSLRDWNLGRVWSLRLSHDGRYLAVGSGTGLTYVIRLETSSK